MTVAAGVAASAILDASPTNPIRVLAVRSQCAVATPGRGVVLQFTQGTQVLAETTTGALWDDTSNVCFALGLNPSPQLLENIDPATGAVTYLGELPLKTGPLPDIAWQQTVTMTLLASGGITDCFALIERW